MTVRSPDRDPGNWHGLYWPNNRPLARRPRVTTRHAGRCPDCGDLLKARAQYIFEAHATLYRTPNGPYAVAGAHEAEPPHWSRCCPACHPEITPDPPRRRAGRTPTTTHQEGQKQ